MKRVASYVGLTSVLALGAFVACSSTSSTDNPGTGSDAGGNDSATTTDGATDSGTAVTQIGKIVALGASATSIPGATVSIQGNTATTDSHGAYTINVTPNSPYTMRVTPANYYSVIEQEWSIATSTDRGKTTLLDNNTGAALVGALQTYGQLDTSLGAIAVIVEKTGSCADVTGAVVNVTCNGGGRCYIPPVGDGGVDGGDAGDDGGGDANITGDGGGGGLGPDHPWKAYFRSGLPSFVNHDVDGTEAISAVIYNLPIGDTVELHVAKPDNSCSMKAFPVTDPGDGDAGAFTYTGKVTTAAANGNIVSAGRVFLQ